MTHQERRSAILSAAVRLFADRGFRGVTTREIAAAVGVSEPVLYQHFATKRDIYNAIIESKIQQTVDRGPDLKPAIEASDDRAFFTILGRAILDWHLHDPSYVRLLLFSGLEGHELAELFHQHHAIRSYRKVVTGYIRKRIRDGAFRKIKPELAARTFSGSLGSYALSRLLFCCEENETPEQMIRTIVDIFLGGVRTAPASDKKRAAGNGAARPASQVTEIHHK